jgi:hypothetical protein
MNEDLLALHTKVNGIIYNPFINLKDQVRVIKSLLSESGKYTEEVTKLEAIVNTLDQLESLNYGNIERIKGFNKAKNTILKIIKEVLSSSQSI